MALEKMKWVRHAVKIISLHKGIKNILKEEWLLTHAQNANPNSTHPIIIHPDDIPSTISTKPPEVIPPAITMLLNLAEENKWDQIAHIEKILQVTPKRKIKNFKTTDYDEFWQVSSELSLYYEILRKFKNKLKYDYTTPNIRTPDFLIEHTKGTIAIEHIAPGEGSYQKSLTRESDDKLKNALTIEKILDEAKKLSVQNPGANVSKILKTEEKELLAKILLGKTKISDEKINALIDKHEIKPVKVFSTIQYVSRTKSPTKEIEFLVSLKSDGAQVRGANFRILTISLPEYFFPEWSLKKIHKATHKDAKNFNLLFSGTVYHSIYGTVKDIIYYGEEEILIKDDCLKVKRKCPVDGFLSCDSSPYHAIIISLYKTHRIRDCGLFPIHLQPKRYFFERLQGKNHFPQSIYRELNDGLNFNRKISITRR